jgi:hypothetical protein
MLLLLHLSGPIVDQTVRLSAMIGAVIQFQFCSIASRHPTSEQIEILTGLTGLTGLPHFPLSLQELDFVAGQKLTH